MRGKCSFQNYYGQFVDGETMRRVFKVIDFRMVHDADSMGKIPLEHWDNVFIDGVPAYIEKKILDSGGWVHKDFLVHVSKLSALKIIQARRVPRDLHILVKPKGGLWKSKLTDMLLGF